MIKLIKAIVTKNEAEAYTHLASIKWNKKTKENHAESLGLTYFQHMIISLRCALYISLCGIFCLFHSFLPNVKSTWATDRLKKFPRWYAAIQYKIKKSDTCFDNINPFSNIL